MLDTTEITKISTLEAIARLEFDPDFSELQRVLLEDRATSLELLACERDQKRLRQLQGEVTAIAQVLGLPDACRKALAARRQRAGS